MPVLSMLPSVVIMVEVVLVSVHIYVEIPKLRLILGTFLVLVIDWASLPIDFDSYG